MMRHYLVPVIGDGKSQATSRRPAYFGNMQGITWGAMDYGHEPWMLAHADLSAFDHDFVSSQPDVMLFPLLDTPLSDDWRTVQLPRLEERLIPTQWVDKTHTSRDLVRRLGHMFGFAQRFSAVADEPLEPENEAAVRDRLSADQVANDWIPAESWQQFHAVTNLLGLVKAKLEEDGHADNAPLRAGHLGLIARYMKGQRKEKTWLQGAKGKDVRLAHGHLKAVHDNSGNFVERFRPFKGGTTLEMAPVDLAPAHRDSWLRTADSFGVTLFATQAARRNLVAFSQTQPFHVHLGGLI